MGIIAVEIDNESKLKKELTDIQSEHELEMQIIAGRIEALNIWRQKNIELSYKRYAISLPKKHKPPDMS